MAAEDPPRRASSVPDLPRSSVTHEANYLARTQERMADGHRASACEVIEMAAHGIGDFFDEDDELLASLKKKKPKKRNPNAKWDGRVEGMHVSEYRAKKWSVDACYAKVERRGPSFSMRPALPVSFYKRNNNFQVGDVYRSLSATLPSAPSFSCGVQSFLPEKDKSPGPSEYKHKSTMDPNRHPTAAKHTGPRFGTEVLEPRDPPGPAPGDYDPNAIIHSSAIRKQPNFSIQGREAWREPTAPPGPGIGEYDQKKLDATLRTGKVTPIKWNMQGKTEPLKRPLGARQHEQPGPPHYNPPGCSHENSFGHPQKKQAPLWKFGSEARGLRN